MFEKIPALDPDNTAFWTGGKHGQLLICHCHQCHTYHHPPTPHCSNCGNDVMAFVPVSGEGQIISYTVNWQPWSGLQDIPFILVVIELKEQKGLWLMSNLVRCSTDQVTIGMCVTVDFIAHPQGIWLPVFHPKEGA